MAPTPIRDVVGYKISMLNDARSSVLRADLDETLLEYYSIILQKLSQAGCEHAYTPEGFMASFWPNLHKLLRPMRRLFFVHDADDHFVGCGALHQVRPDACEVKRLYIRPEASGHGLGHAVTPSWIEAAREVRFHTLLLNVINTNLGPLRIYDGFGFKTIDRYSECSDPIAVDPYFVYLLYEIR